MRLNEGSGVLCDKRILMMLKGNLYKRVVRLIMSYGSECWADDNKIGQRMSVADMRMLKWMKGVTREDTIRN